jgi:branched-chain amino acid transport system permease protein
VQSGGVLLATFIGGSGYFFGPVIGAVIFVLFAVALSSLTHAWLLYLGLFFVLAVMFVPGGVASVLMKQMPLFRARKLGRMAPSYAMASCAGGILLAALIVTVELVYKLQFDSDNGTDMTLAGFAFDAASFKPWLVAAVLWVLGGMCGRWAVMRVRRDWDQVHTEIAGGGV